MTETMKETKVTYTLETDGKFVIIENVPARVCEETGEQFFSPDIVERLQKRSGNTKNQRKRSKRRSMNSLYSVVLSHSPSAGSDRSSFLPGCARLCAVKFDFTGKLFCFPRLGRRFLRRITRRLTEAAAKPQELVAASGKASLSANRAAKPQERQVKVVNRSF